MDGTPGGARDTVPVSDRPWRRVLSSDGVRAGSLTTRTPADGLGAAQKGEREALSAERECVQAGGDSLQEPPLPNGGLVQATAAGEQPAVLTRNHGGVAGQQLRTPVAQGDPEVVGGIAHETIGIHEDKASLGAGPGLENLQAVGRRCIAMDDDAALRVERSGASLGAIERQGDCLLGARPPELLPQADNQLVQPAGLVHRDVRPRSERSRDGPRRAEHLAQRAQLNLWPQANPVERRTESLQEDSMSREVLRQQTDIASPSRPDEGRHLPFKVRVRDGDLDDHLGTSGGVRLRDEGGCPPWQRLPDPDGPLLLQNGGEARQLLNPTGADISRASRLLPNDVWYVNLPHRQQRLLLGTDGRATR